MVDPKGEWGVDGSVIQCDISSGMSLGSKYGSSGCSNTQVLGASWCMVDNMVLIILLFNRTNYFYEIRLKKLTDICDVNVVLQF